MESGNKKEDDVSHVHFYKPVVVNCFSCCVVTVDASWKDIFKLCHLRKVIFIQLADIFNLRQPGVIYARGVRGFPRQRMGSDRHYMFCHPLIKRDIYREEESLILAKDIITGGDGSEQSPFQFTIELIQYVHFRVTADFRRRDTSIARSYQVR